MLKLSHYSCAILTGAALAHCAAVADERRFTYVYEPETMPAGAFEVENWVTLRTQRSKEVGQDNFNRWDLRQELEYGVTDRYQVALYLNEQSQSYQDPITGADESEFEWKGIALENLYNVLNPAEHAVGVTAYLEGAYSGDEAALEQKLIFGQRYGAWKWALNIEHETEWEDNLDEVEAEIGGSFGIARDFKNFSVGVELRNVNVFPEYEEWENSAIYAGPVVSYRQDKWWAALTVLPQIYGWNSDENDGSDHLDLAHNEKLQVRLLVGIHF